MQTEWTTQDREYFEQNPSRAWYVRPTHPEEVGLIMLRADPDTRRAWEEVLSRLKQSDYSAELQIAVVQIESGHRVRLPVIAPLNPSEHETRPHIIFCDGGPITGLERLDKVAAELRTQRTEQRERALYNSIDHCGDECAKCKKPFTEICVTFVYPHPQGGSAYVCESCGEKRLRRRQVVSYATVYVPQTIDMTDPVAVQRMEKCSARAKSALKKNPRQ